MTAAELQARLDEIDIKDMPRAINHLVEARAVLDNLQTERVEVQRQLIEALKAQIGETK